MIVFHDPKISIFPARSGKKVHLFRKLKFGAMRTIVLVDIVRYQYPGYLTKLTK
ncbi:hypothetical protein [Emticicia fluvialis]|uniref:hypothetical protein n=1 Tax=Emticicia fluvialis TaxID=2974474 RepID=UPI0021658DF0|nr:hypothetical protein [Emticicia fluvialis]